MMLRAGIITFLAGVYLYRSVPIWLRFFGVGPWGEGLVIRHIGVAFRSLVPVDCCLSVATNAHF
jgi:hypothetical protein